MPRIIYAVTDPKADVDDIAAIYQLAINPDVELHLVLGANAEVSATASESYLKLNELAAHAQSKGQTFKINEVLTFEAFLSETAIVCDELLNISPWSAVETLPEPLKEVVSNGCQHITVKDMVVHQGTVYTGETKGFNTDLYNTPFFERMNASNQFMELNSDLCAQNNGLMANSDYLAHMPSFLSEFLLANSFKQLVSRAPAQISNPNFSVLGLVDPDIGRGANFHNAKKYYDLCLKESNDNITFEDLPLTESALQLASEYVDAALAHIDAREIAKFQLSEAQREATIDKLARINSVIEKGFGVEFFNQGTVVNLSSDPRDFPAAGASIEAAYKKFQEVPIVYTPLYDLQACLLLNSYHALKTSASADPKAEALALMQPDTPRSSLMTFVIEEFERLSKPTHLAGAAAEEPSLAQRSETPKDKKQKVSAAALFQPAAEDNGNSSPDRSTSLGKN